MDEKGKGGNATPENSDKGTSFSTTAKVLTILKSGEKVTAVKLNRQIGFNDGRKAISVLRGLGYPIQDFRLPDRRKVYYFPSNWEQIMSEKKQNDKQLKLF
jgi:hypothetical protein